MGRLIPAGTGMPKYRYMGIRIEGGDAEAEDEPARSRARARAAPKAPPRAWSPRVRAGRETFEA